MPLRSNRRKGKALFTDIHRLPSPTGASLAWRHCEAEHQVRGVLLICHGMVEHSGRYARFAKTMALQGFEVYAFDHRGHGRTTAADAPHGRFAWRNGVSLVLRDVKAMRDMVSERHPGLPIILFGHSMGGLIALNAAIDYPRAFDAVSIWNSNFNPGMAGKLAKAVLWVEKALKGSDVPSTILPRATFRAWNQAIKGHKTDYDWLSHDPETTESYANDPFCRFEASVSLWQDVFELMYRALPLAPGLPRDLPVYLVSGSEDAATRGGTEIRWLADRLRRAGLVEVVDRIYPGMRHETLNEKGWEIPVADFAAWCREVADKA